MADRAAKPVRVLVVEDNPDLRRALEIMLRGEGFAVEGAGNGVDALGIQAQRPAQILLTDIVMPERDGIETIATFKHRYSTVKIVAMSGAAGGRGETYLYTAQAAGADAVLSKPFERGDLVATLRAMIGAKRPRV